MKFVKTMVALSLLMLGSTTARVTWLRQKGECVDERGKWPKGNKHKAFGK